MSAIKVTEDIGYFAGYLRLNEEFDKARELYDAFGNLRIVSRDEGDPGQPDKLAELEDPDLGVTGRVRSPDIPDLPGTTSPEIPEKKFTVQTAPSQPMDVELKDLSNTLPPVGLGGGGGGVVSPQFSVAYFEGGEDRIIEIRQSNLLNDSDFVGNESYGEPLAHQINILETLNGMLQTAEAKAAEALLVPDEGTAIVDFVHGRDAEKAEAGPMEPAIGNGIYVNGMLVDQPPDSPVQEPEVAEPPAGQGHLNPAVDAELGGNSAINAALIVDYNEATTSMVVLGDYFASNAIIQTNVLKDNDSVEVAGGGTGTALKMESPEPLNIASFLTTEVNFDGWGHSWTWRVEFVEGDLYDVKVLAQTNVMLDNDTVVQSTSSSHSTIVAGENEQYNVTDIFDLGKHYDLIVVTGDYHSANWIFQTNILLDDDFVKVVGGEGTDSATVATGGNRLINDAAIEHIGSLDFKPLSENPAIDDFIKGIGAKSVDPTFAWDMYASGHHFDVLYVKGSYYDINVIKQLNVMSDVDTAVQYLPGEVAANLANAGGDENNGVHNSLSTGGNDIKNIAKIVDVGTFAKQYLGGDFYEETILVQANIIEDSDHNNHVSPNDQKIYFGDTKTLASEVIAFTGSESGDGLDHSEPVKGVHGQHDDMMGSVLT
ncbi:MAG TPA: hypothetical protein VNL39_01465 [Xanthobacteraceae bacterium]|nr:hypothetical protein [Xanthobacteraceae bacterium]